MKKHLLLLMSVLSITSELAFAGAGTYLKIRNDSNQDAYITSLDSQCWYSNDLQDNVVNAHTVKVLYTELKNSGICFLQREWFQNFRIKAGELVGNFGLYGFIGTNHDADYDIDYYILYSSNHAVSINNIKQMSGTYYGYIEITDTNNFNDKKMKLSKTRN